MERERERARGQRNQEQQNYGVAAVDHQCESTVASGCEESKGNPVKPKNLQIRLIELVTKGVTSTEDGETGWARQVTRSMALESITNTIKHFCGHGAVRARECAYGETGAGLA